MFTPQQTRNTAAMWSAFMCKVTISGLTIHATIDAAAIATASGRNRSMYQRW